METKRTHFKMYKDGRKWVFACAVVLALGGGTTVAHADSQANNSSDQSATSQVAMGSNSSTSSQNTSTSSTANDGAKSDTTEGTTTQTSGATKMTTSGDTENGKDNANTNAVVESTKLTDTTDSSAVTDSSQSQQNQASQPDQKTDANSNSTQPNQSNQQAKQFAQTAQNVSRAAKSTVPSGGSVYDDYPTLEDDNLLGISSAFHIFARDAELNAHTNGNVAVQNLTGNVNFGTNIIEELLDKDISYIQNITKIANSSFVSAGDTRENKVIFGEGITVDVSNPNRPKVNGIDIDHLVASEVYQDQNGQTYIDFDKEFEKLRNKNVNFAAADSVRDYTAADFDDQNNRVIDVTDMTPDENGRIVLNLSPEVLQGNTPLTIKGLSPDADGNTVIINVDTGSDPDYTINSEIKVIYSDGTDRNNHETEDFGDNHLLWNFVDRSATDQQYTGTIHVERRFQGSMLAPSATIIAKSNIDGNIIADKVIVNAETHRWDLQDNKNPKPEPEPEPEPETPEPEPEPEPEAPEPETPEPEPEPEPENPEPETPEPEPEPEPESPEPETPEPETPGTESPEPESPEPETPVTEEPDVEEENSYAHHHQDDEIVEEFEEEIAADTTEAQREVTLEKLETAIAEAKAAHDTTLVAQLEAVEQQLLVAMGRSTGVGTGLPQTGEAHSSWAQLLGLSLAGSLLGGWLVRRKRQN
ncbi:hypothetical protein LZY01_12830 [Levilactobacillus zymae]|uniref:Gram-positive cocci surface proteins LPxTG domain-containing protein n=1 Tax=Levilactobacillus zymae TaxID=267363 RepID=A0ABQ0WW67_9LACO|nr:collagen-binding domain-containing protein [Levilactobacillus zymae]KRL08713.1 hypothetical protein FD38_GL002342 [Levilactobacillus zymae DSM 19395]QFR61550.1 LPXTG cell wall anchor domain-containing protein [Levilactobacillus zymae]GEO72115.1 hypothetical protein LZY01_12830 [Levilactobacillus zymae]